MMYARIDQLLSIAALASFVGVWTLGYVATCPPDRPARHGHFAMTVRP